MCPPSFSQASEVLFAPSPSPQAATCSEVGCVSSGIVDLLMAGAEAPACPNGLDGLRIERAGLAVDALPYVATRPLADNLAVAGDRVERPDGAKIHDSFLCRSCPNRHAAG